MSNTLLQNISLSVGRVMGPFPHWLCGSRTLVLILFIGGLKFYVAVLLKKLHDFCCLYDSNGEHWWGLQKYEVARYWYYYY